MSDEERIMLKIVADNVELGFFIIEKTANFFQFMRAATLRANIPMDAMRFIYNGINVKAADTPQGLGMKTGQVLTLQMNDPTNFPDPA